MTTKTQLLSKVQYSNLLVINWNEQKIQTNFQLIVEALSQQQKSNCNFKDDLNILKEEIANLKKNNLAVQKSFDILKQNNRSEQKINSSDIQHGEENKSQMKNLDNNVINQKFDRIKKQIENLQISVKSINQQLSNPKFSFDLNNPNKSEENLQTINENKYNQLLADIKNQINQIKPQISKLNEDVGILKLDNVKINAKLNTNQNIQNQQRSSKLSGKNSTKPRNSAQLLVEDKQNHSSSLIQEKKNATSQMEEQLNNLYLDTNTLRLCYQQIKILFSDLKRSDSKKDAILNDLSQKINNINQKLKQQKQSQEKQFKSIRNSILINQPTPKKQNSVIPPNSQTQKKSKNYQSENCNERINDKLSKLQNMLQSTVTEGEFDRFKDEVKNEFKNLQNKIKNMKQQFISLNESTNNLQNINSDFIKKIQKNQSDLNLLKNLLNDRCATLDRKNNILNSKIQESKKDLQYVKQDLEYYKNNLLKQPTIVNTSSKSDEQEKSNHQLNSKKLQDLKKQFTNKLHDLRGELINMIRDFERKSLNKNHFEQDITMLFDKISQLKLFINKKADAEDTKKNFNYLQKKISLALNSIGKEDEAVEDARIAKKNWFCLSCDKLLDNYTGKVGKHVVWDGLHNSKSFLKNTPKNEKIKDSFPTLNSTTKK